MTGIRAWSSSTMTLTRISGRKKTIFQRRSIWPWAGLGILLQAALKAPASVLFVIGLPTAVTRYFPYADILEIPLSRRGLEELVRFIYATYKRDVTGQTIPLG